MREEGKCPECGADLTSSEGGCTICGPDREAGRASLRRSRRRNIAILLSLFCAAIVLIGIWSIWPELTASPAQKLLVTSDDLGPGWSSTTPEKGSSLSPGGADTALVRVGLTDGPYYYDGHVSLDIYPTQELADASYQKGVEAYGGAPIDIAAGVRAMSVQHVQDDMVWHQLLMMQKGSSIVWISLMEVQHSAAVETAWMVELAEAQGAKLP